MNPTCITRVNGVPISTPWNPFSPLKLPGIFSWPQPHHLLNRFHLRMLIQNPVVTGAMEPGWHGKNKRLVVEPSTRKHVEVRAAKVDENELNYINPYKSELK